MTKVMHAELLKTCV